MTNVSSGQKRSWEGSENGSNKRYRDKEEPKDWRDVHMRSPARKPPLSSKYHGSDRRSPSYYDNRRGSDSSSRKRKDSDYYRSSEFRESRHGRDDRDSGRRERHRVEDVSRSPRRRGRSTDKKADDEREEGETLNHQHPTASMKQTCPPPEMELELPPSPPPVEAILAKYAGIASVSTSISPSPGPSSAVPLTPSLPGSSTNPSGIPSGVSTHVQNEDASNGQGTLFLPRFCLASASLSPAPKGFALAKEMEEGRSEVDHADYDPSLDRREDEKRRLGGDPLKQDVIQVDDEEDDEEEDEDEDLDDMFAVVMSDKPAKKKKTKAKPAAPALITTTTLDSASDPEGYYNVILGEQLDGERYQVFASLGQGMFANVVRARVLTGDANEIGREVAIKIIRSQESMHRAGLKEIQILNKLKQADPEDKKHIIRLERSFEHRGHLCLVFESMSMNLRDVVKRFGKDVGLNIRAVRAYAHQLFLALSLLKKVNIMHADIKPDNILVNEQKTVIKLCDLGSASDASENEITPYLVSRFYRAPEIIMGIPYDSSLDIWSIGCTLYELYTGKILFPGRSNNHMLLLMMELKGRFNSKMIKKATFGDLYFDEMGGFESIEKDRLTGNDVVRKVHISKPARDLKARLMPPASAKVSDEEMKLITSFVDLLDKCLVLDPSRRISPREALVHPFIRG
ncbi:kinase-like domain-containing protein [Panaeolus papilionaceus]|nr:kinase-like domain-containing protein [Panaeolus papilionaceus]